jgi:hypothetical protein
VETHLVPDRFDPLIFYLGVGMMCKAELRRMT